jgi:NAD(P)-dependent dehydrogenase (short-subunit alcohol dehydrogenase family)
MTAAASHAAFVTGSSRGIGLGVAIALARKGFNIALNCPAEDEELHNAERAVAELGVRTVKVAGDVSILENHVAMLDRAEAAIGPLSTLVNNAGVSVRSRGDLLDVTEDSYDNCMAVNAKAQFFLSQAFAQRLVDRERNDDRFYSLINVTSANASSVAVQRGEYCASKSAAAMISRVFSVRLGREGIAVYDIRPGLIETDMTRTVKDEYLRRIEEEDLTLFPRLGQPSDIGAIIATLATGGLPYTTGQVISADAGMLVSRF